MNGELSQPKKIKRAIMRSSQASALSHTHANKVLLDSISQKDFDAISNNTEAINLLNARVNSIANLFGITFDSNGAIVSENYTSHTHSYEDDTINGTGVVSTETKSTSGVE